MTHLAYGTHAAARALTMNERYRRPKIGLYSILVYSVYTRYGEANEQTSCLNRLVQLICLLAYGSMRARCNKHNDNTECDLIIDKFYVKPQRTSIQFACV